ncbi:helix-turn-helix domain-containing protein [Streptomyces sp. DSM 44917]|uniref:Helix-turn-helix domain-containing protein n=1 Tax=Streptomyces boetiae TaxID=3075541 RepID=A0ABU2LDZ8_9ACTN|nr:helix-turn-helix domain-containing protein [Streptomyces sp. DSM 44917]MDT0309716.1 helix-turn-helix domain-containing protein [Streptomyces sp. DSM 44917]
MVIRTVFRSEDLPPEERLPAFDGLQVASPHSMHVRSDAPDFRATARGAELGIVDLVELTCSTADVWRTPRQIRASDPELVSVVFALRGSLGVVQAGREAALNGRDFAVYDSSRPFHVHIGADADTATLVRAHVPRALLSLPPGGAGRLLAVPLPGEEGVGALLTRFLTGLTTGTPSYGPADITRLGTIALDLLTATLAHHAEAERAVDPDSRQRVLFLRAQAFTRERLHDPELTPAAIAAAHHVSVGHLHRVFQAHGTSVAAWVRHQRLEGARRDLADPALWATPVHGIATRWGFKDHATFTRAFRTAYGAPPRDYRHQAYSPPLRETRETRPRPARRR